jgi:ABC-type sugar transport system permease subunit
MQKYYYINAKNKKDGPHDLITIMRRIRSGIILPDTLACQGENEELVLAYSIKDLSPFFNRPTEDIRHELNKKYEISIIKTFKKGWQFTTEHQNLTAFSGATLLLASIVGLLTQELLHNIASSITAAFLMFLFLQSCFFAVSLRLYRGQKTDAAFIEYTLTPIIGKLAFVSVLFSFFIVGGVLLVIPGVIAMLIAAYMPMFILDYNFSIIKTVNSIISLLSKLDKISLLKLGFIVLFYMICVALIIPIPIIMTIMAGSLCSIYEDLSNS